MASDDQVLLTAEEAESLLPDGPRIHNFANPGMNVLIGCDFDRADAIKAFKDAFAVELGGEACKSMKHPIAVWETAKRVTFFEADMAKVEALEKAREAASSKPQSRQSKR